MPGTGARATSLGVPEGAYTRADNFRQRVFDPAVLEVNGLSDMSLQIELVRRHSRAPVDAVTLAWWRKSGDEFRAAVAERNRSKLGRMARLRGEVETTEAAAPVSQARQGRGDRGGDARGGSAGRRYPGVHRRAGGGVGSKNGLGLGRVTSPRGRASLVDVLAIRCHQYLAYDER
jgi:Initiator Replication protein